MKLSPDDPKLTAYALGELDSAEAEAMKRELENSPELRAALKEIQDTADFLKDEFAAEERLVLLLEQKETITAEVPPSNVVPLPRGKVAMFVGITAIAASVMAIVGWNIWFAPKTNDLRDSLANHSEFRYAQNAHEAELKKLQGKNALPHAKETSVQAPKPEATVQKPAEIIPPPATVPVLEPLPEVKVEAKFADISQANQSAVGTTPPADASDHSASTPGATAPSQVQITGGLGSDGKIASFAFQVPPATSLASTDAKQASGPSSVDPANAVGYVNVVPDSFNRNPQAAAVINNGTLNPPQKQMSFQNDLYAQLPPDNFSIRSSHESTLRPIPRNTARSWGDQIEAAKKPAQKRLKSMALEELPEPVLGVRYRYDRRLPRLENGNTARYPRYVENSFESVLNVPLSTFSTDVDTASYANVRRFLNEGRMPLHDAVRVEELVNYFAYNYPQPRGSEPFSVNMEVAGCPWNKAHRLVRIGLKGKEIAQEKRPPSNFVFLIDVSGSMQPSERLPLIKQALRMLVKRMTENDRIAMVVYASSSGVVLESTSCANKERILEAIDRLEAGGSTNGGEGIQKAYRLAEENFIKGGVNRVILATDGDFNVGITDQNELVNMIQRKAKSGVFLSALGVGTDNYKDALLQKLADKGNGNYHYLDTLEEAQKVLIQQMNGTLVTIAKDVKIQVEFNPAQVKSYRLIGYEKRILEAQDFNNDKKDAGEIGAGHTVTALYEIVPANAEDEPSYVVDELKYQPKHAPRSKHTEKRSFDTGRENSELLTVKLRYKKPDGNTSKLVEFPLLDEGKKFSSASTDFQFAASVASFGMLLKNSEYSGDFSYDAVLETAQSAKGDDKEGYRAEFINLVKKAKGLARAD